jgi:hypothetical protein
VDSSTHAKLDARRNLSNAACFLERPGEFEPAATALCNQAICTDADQEGLAPLLSQSSQSRGAKRTEQKELSLTSADDADKVYGIAKRIREYRRFADSRARAEGTWAEAL